MALDLPFRPRTALIPNNYLIVLVPVWLIVLVPVCAPATELKTSEYFPG